MPGERPMRFERLCFRALAEGAISEAKAAELLGHSGPRAQPPNGRTTEIGGTFCQSLSVATWKRRPQTTRRQVVTERRSNGFDSLRLHHFICVSYCK